ncbi:hypothetical protein TSTA_045390 [Talaromyces stipitatus ATCC 10500]|uniref:RNase H type-1 domain-containing protein n=1 Tax=Talaromyces stipitatus (strain ATCC 10500 / CBS 375.48 / QM 6759 / NRRL 1006) TaxID=441959 RepID=B8MII5_TALSN|nr:uncharacterized protein TSTA_045390 [Talaromyces stipitatus ATCC 10500]EED15077.1 hypothetical protein TSTA_045390 [Talaromyces stipitatus ATCC 10500]
MDGSGYQGYIGASMVIPTFRKQRTECIGTEGASTVYAAKVCHEGVPRNEAADRAAKRAALMGARRQIVPGDLSSEGWTILAAAAKRRIRQSIKDAWERQ